MGIEKRRGASVPRGSGLVEEDDGWAAAVSGGGDVQVTMENGKQIFDGRRRRSRGACVAAGERKRPRSLRGGSRDIRAWRAGGG